MDIEVGKTYKNPKGKIGVVESIEEKFKTIMLRDVDGRSFNISIATFHREWTESEDEVLYTSTQKTDERNMIEDAYDSAVHLLSTSMTKERDPHKKGRVAYSDKQILSVLRAIEDIVEYTLYHYEQPPFKHKHNLDKHNVTMSGFTKRHMFYIYPHIDEQRVRIHIDKDLWDEVIFDKELGDIECQYKESFTRPYTIFAEPRNLASMLNSIIEAYKIVYERRGQERRERKLTLKKQRHTNLQTNEEREENKNA